jgi:hypothetical protein
MQITLLVHILSVSATYPMPPLTSFHLIFTSTALLLRQTQALPRSPPSRPYLKPFKLLGPKDKTDPTNARPSSVKPSSGSFSASAT